MYLLNTTCTFISHGGDRLEIGINVINVESQDLISALTTVIGGWHKKGQTWFQKLARKCCRFFLFLNEKVWIWASWEGSVTWWEAHFVRQVSLYLNLVAQLCFTSTFTFSSDSTRWILCSRRANGREIQEEGITVKVLQKKVSFQKDHFSFKLAIFQCNHCQGSHWEPTPPWEINRSQTMILTGFLNSPRHFWRLRL